ncbi:MAG: RNA/single-stranded DNA exonuclease, partial [Ruminococcus sp.]|nr:RNA/single-stranded DNA exonuclease [Ruminococcus sp.]
MKRKLPFPVIFVALLMLANTIGSAVLLSFYSLKYFFVSLSIAIVLTIIFILVLFFMTKSLYRHISRMNRLIKTAGAEYITSLPSPVAVIDDNNTIIWYNEFFREKVALERDAFGLNIQDCINIDILSLKNGENRPCSVNGSIYDVSAKKDSIKTDSIYVLSFQDATEVYKLQKQLVETHHSILVIMLDNYDDIMQNAKESEKAKTTVEAQQLIENFMADTNGIAKSISNNTFLIIMEDCHINKIIEEKFKILDLARNIKIGERTPLTLSIGVGQGTDTLAESEILARQCLD